MDGYLKAFLKIPENERTWNQSGHTHKLQGNKCYGSRDEQAENLVNKQKKKTRLVSERQFEAFVKEISREIHERISVVKLFEESQDEFLEAFRTKFLEATREEFPEEFPMKSMEELLEAFVQESPEEFPIEFLDGLQDKFWKELLEKPLNESQDELSEAFLKGLLEKIYSEKSLEGFIQEFSKDL